MKFNPLRWIISIITAEIILVLIFLLHDVGYAAHINDPPIIDKTEDIVMRGPHSFIAEIHTHGNKRTVKILDFDHDQHYPMRTGEVPAGEKE